MKKISIQVNLILLLSALASNVSFGQTYPFSEERYNYPVRTDATNPPIKVLVIPVQLNGINSSGQSCDGWVTTCFPENGIPVDIDKYFDNSIGVGGPVGYFTKYYYDASFGNFVVLGDYLDVVVNLPYCGSSNVGGKVMKLLYDTYGLNLPLHYNSPLSDFDKYTLDAPQVQGYPKVVAPNLRFDHVIFLIRNNPEWGSAVGFGCAETSILPGDPVS